MASNYVEIKSSETLNELFESREVNVIRKSQKTEGFNYYFSPILIMKLYNPKVLIVNQKYIVFQFKKYENLSLLNMLRNFSVKLLDFVKRFYLIDAKNVYNIASEQEDVFTIRCSLPSFNKIDCRFYGENVKFQLPKTQVHIDKVSVIIKNLWESKDRIGYNIELKSVIWEKF